MLEYKSTNHAKIIISNHNQVLRRMKKNKKFHHNHINKLDGFLFILSHNIEKLLYEK